MAIGFVNGFAMTVDVRQSMRWLYERSRPARGAICRAVLLGWAGGCAFIVQAFLLSRIIHGVVIEARPREALRQAREVVPPAWDPRLSSASVSRRSLLIRLRAKISV